MELKQYISILWRRKWVIILTTLVTLVAVIIGTLVTRPTYTATTTLRIASSASGTISYYDYMYADRLMNTYVKLATSTPVLDELKTRLQVKILPSIDVAVVPQTELIQIDIEHSDPIFAAKAANSLADILISQSLQLYTGGGQSSLQILSDQVTQLEGEVNQARADYLSLVADDPNNTTAIDAAKAKLDLEQQMYVSVLQEYEQSRLEESQREKSISVVDPAIPPESPSKPRKTLNVALGLIGGLAAGLGLAFLFENLDATLYTMDQIEAASQLPTMGKVPVLNHNDPLLSVNGNFVSKDAFRRLRTNMVSMDIPIRTLLVVSAEPKEGKSTIAANLAYIMAQSGQKVVIVDGDFWAPTQHTIFKIENNVGLSSVLENNIAFSEMIKPTDFPGLHILTSGPLPKNPPELLGSDQMSKLIKQLSQEFDLVIIDTPALLSVSDADILAPLVDAVAIVVCRSKTSSGSLRALLAELAKTRARVIGVIVNRAEQSRSQYYYRRKETFTNS